MENNETQAHYRALLARNYLWMSGGRESNIAQNSRFFLKNAIIPTGSSTAVDLGAGCGFQSLALASAGFSVVAVDFSRVMLQTLAQEAGTLPIRIVPSDILAFKAWAGLHPTLIVCMGDTITHLPDSAAVRNLVRHCAKELVPGGRMVVTFRDYSREQEGTTVVIPVRRDTNRIFVCRLKYGTENIRVEDILYTRESGTWVRAAGSYTKIRLAPDDLKTMMAKEGFTTRELESESGTATIIAQKPL
jgi:SAM-dependent methyltransferase